MIRLADIARFRLLSHGDTSVAMRVSLVAYRANAAICFNVSYETYGFQATRNERRVTAFRENRRAIVSIGVRVSPCETGLTARELVSPILTRNEVRFYVTFSF